MTTSVITPGDFGVQDPSMNFVAAAAWRASSRMMNSSFVPARMPRRRRASDGIVTCPYDVTVTVMVLPPYFSPLHHGARQAARQPHYTLPQHGDPVPPPSSQVEYVEVHAA